MKIFHHIIEHWRTDWHNHRDLFFMELTGVLLNALATASLSFMVNNPPMLFCYVCWFLGSALLAYTSYQRESSWIFCLMAFYTTMNIVGLVALVLN